MLRSLFALAMGLSLSACATQYAPLYSPGEVVRAAEADATSPIIYGTGQQGLSTPAVTSCKTKTSLEQTLACAEVLQGVYSAGYRNTSDWRDLASLPVIGGAGLGALILLNGKDNAAKNAGKIGIGVGVISALREQFVPASVPASFIKGHAALGCIIGEGEYFAGPNAAPVARNLATQIGVVTRARDNLGRLRFAVPSDNNPAAADLLKAARTIAEQALDGAATQIETSAGQWTAFQFANAVFRKAVTDVGAWVASKGRTRPDLSYNQLVGELSPPPPTRTEAVGSGDPGTQNLEENAKRASSLTTAELLQALSEGSSTLVTAVNVLKGATPDYKGRLAAATQCATSLPSG